MGERVYAMENGFLPWGNLRVPVELESTCGANLGWGRAEEGRKEKKEEKAYFTYSIHCQTLLMRPPTQNTKWIFWIFILEFERTQKPRGLLRVPPKLRHQKKVTFYQEKTNLCATVAVRAWFGPAPHIRGAHTHAVPAVVRLTP